MCVETGRLNEHIMSLTLTKSTKWDCPKMQFCGNWRCGNFMMCSSFKQIFFGMKMHHHVCLHVNLVSPQQKLMCSKMKWKGQNTKSHVSMLLANVCVWKMCDCMKGKVVHWNDDWHKITFKKAEIKKIFTLMENFFVGKCLGIWLWHARWRCKFEQPQSDQHHQTKVFTTNTWFKF